MHQIIISDDQNTITIGDKHYTFVEDPEAESCHTKCALRGKKIEGETICHKIPCMGDTLIEPVRKDGLTGIYQLNV